jgi:hypothetical protein
MVGTDAEDGSPTNHRRVITDGSEEPVSMLSL